MAPGDEVPVRASYAQSLALIMFMVRADRNILTKPPLLGAFKKAMDAAGKSFAIHWYEADHAFANHGGRYNAAEAAVAWERTLAFLKNHL